MATCGWTINTAFVERLKLDIRQRVAAIGRRVNTLCQGEAGVRDQMTLFQVYHNCVLPHQYLRQNQGHLVFHFNPNERQRLYRLGSQPTACCCNVRMACPPQQANRGVA